MDVFAFIHIGLTILVVWSLNYFYLKYARLKHERVVNDLKRDIKTQRNLAELTHENCKDLLSECKNLEDVVNQKQGSINAMKGKINHIEKENQILQQKLDNVVVRKTPKTATEFIRYSELESNRLENIIETLTVEKNLLQQKLDLIEMADNHVSEKITELVDENENLKNTVKQHEENFVQMISQNKRSVNNFDLDVLRNEINGLVEENEKLTFLNNELKVDFHRKKDAHRKIKKRSETYRRVTNAVIKALRKEIKALKNIQN